MVSKTSIVVENPAIQAELDSFRNLDIVLNQTGTGVRDDIVGKAARILHHDVLSSMIWQTFLS
jgi:hypothetical protein